MTLDQRLARAVHHVADGVPPPVVDIAAVRSRARTNRRRAVSLTVTAVVVVAVVLAGTALVTGRDDASAPAPVDPVRPPRLAGSLPVWYDSAGLHHGDRVEQTAVELLQGGREGGLVLALVRDGALYGDPASGDVWYHPWGGRPRMVGHSETGPGGDPTGAVAAWFDGGELVVFDTARGREISRTDETPVTFSWRDHLNSGNGFRYISADEVVWASADSISPPVTHRLDLATGGSAVLWEDRRNLLLDDVHGATRIWSDLAAGKFGDMVIDVHGREERRPEAVEPSGRLSAAGSYVLAPTETKDTHGAAIVDVRSGETWNLLPRERRFYAWISWSYGDVALVLVDREGREQRLLACDAVKRECHQLPHQGEVLLPTS